MIERVYFLGVCARNIGLACLSVRASKLFLGSLLLTVVGGLVAISATARASSARADAADRTG